MVSLWVIEIIKYADLKFGKYDAWNIKIDCKPSILDEIKTFSKTTYCLSNKQMKIVDFQMSISSMQFCIRDKINPIEDREEKN